MRREVTKTNGLAITGATGQAVDGKPPVSFARGGTGSPSGRILHDAPVSFQALVMALLGVEPPGSPGFSGLAGDGIQGVRTAEEVSKAVTLSAEVTGWGPGGVCLEGAVPLPAHSGPEGLLSSLPGEFRVDSLAGLKTEEDRHESVQAGSGPVQTGVGTKAALVAETGGKLLRLAAPGSSARTPAPLEAAGDNVPGEDSGSVDTSGPGAVDNPPGLVGAPGEGWGGAMAIMREISPAAETGLYARAASSGVFQSPRNPGGKVAVLAADGNPGLAGSPQTPGVAGDGRYSDIPETKPVGDGKGADAGGDEGPAPAGERRDTRGTPQVPAAGTGITRTAHELPVDKMSAVSGRVTAENSAKLVESAVPSPSGEGARPKALEMQIVDPEFGKLTVLLTSRGSDLNIRFLSPDARVREVLWETRYELYDAMSGKGLNLAGFTVESGWNSPGEGMPKGKDRVAARAATVSRPVAEAEPVVALRTRSWGLVDYFI